MMKIGSNEITRIIQRGWKNCRCNGGVAAERRYHLKRGEAVWSLDRSGFDAEACSLGWKVTEYL